MSGTHVNDCFIETVSKLIDKTNAKVIKMPKVSCQILDNRKTNLFTLKPIWAKQAPQVVDALTLKASYGHDNISTAMLKKFPMAVMQALETIINVSEIFSDQWKYSIVTPVFKRSDV